MFYEWGNLTRDQRVEIGKYFMATPCMIDFKNEVDYKQSSLKIAYSRLNRLCDVLRSIELNSNNKVNGVVVLAGSNILLEHFELIENVLRCSNIKVILEPNESHLVKLYISLRTKNTGITSSLLTVLPTNKDI